MIPLGQPDLSHSRFRQLLGPKRSVTPSLNCALEIMLLTYQLLACSKTSNQSQSQISLCHFYGATTNFKPCYRRKIAFSRCKAYKVNCACALSRDLCTEGPPKPHVTIFWPRIVYSLYNFYGATMTIKGRLILEHTHVKAVFGREKNLSAVKIGPRNGSFSEI